MLQAPKHCILRGNYNTSDNNYIVSGGLEGNAINWSVQDKNK